MRLKVRLLLDSGEVRGDGVEIHDQDLGEASALPDTDINESLCP